MPASWRTLADLVVGAWAPAGRERVLQVAVAGRWEEARRLALPADGDACRALLAPVEAAADVAVEAEWLGHPLVFVGARRRPADDVAFVADVARAARADPDDPAAALRALAGGEPTGPAEIELGAANAWQSVGPLGLWDPGRPWVPGTLAQRLADHPALGLCHVPVALEVAFAGARECWIGAEVSEPEGTRHRVEAPRVEALVAALLAVARP